MVSTCKLPKPQKNKPWKFKHLTVEHVYEPLAKSSGKVYQLTQAMRAASNIGEASPPISFRHRRQALRTRLGKTLGIALVSDTAEQYEANIEKAFGSQMDLFR